MDKLDFKKTEKQFYQPKKIEQIDVPAMKFITIDGDGAPSGDEFQTAVAALFPVAYAISMSYKGDYKIPGFQPFVVAPLEGLWTSETADYTGDKNSLIWKVMLRMPDFVTEDVTEWAKAEAERKKKADFSAVKLEQLTDGLCIQAMHLGSFDDEPATFEAMEAFAAAQALQPEHRAYHHREIYLSDFRKTAPEKLKTVLRLFVK
ncbi:GyrI-like domain-containing protein [Lactovum odontotermitis]